MAEATFIPLMVKLVAASAPEALRQLSSFIAPLHEIRTRIERIKDEKEIMEAFLSCADKHRDGQDEPVSAWIKLVTDQARRMEDIIDEYTYLLGARSRKGLKGSVYNVMRDTKNIRAWYRIATQLRETETELFNLLRTKQQYGVDPSSGGSSSSRYEGCMWHRLAESAHFIEDEEIVGFDGDRKQLCDWLTEDDEPKRTVITICGIGGVGKTTLVTNVYKSQMIRNHFDCRAWICVSQNYTTNDLLRKMIKEFYEEKREIIPHGMESMDYRRLVEMLREHLQDKRYLLILDGMWSTSVWTEIDQALGDSKCKNRVVVTTRNLDVASLKVGRRLIEVERLEEEDAWRLFGMKAFKSDTDRSCPQELEHYARKIVEKCRGLPLAIVTLGRLLALKEKNESEWEKVHDNIIYRKTEGSELKSVHSILYLSINDLPCYLRNCFMYCSIFPEDYPITRKRLVRLWISEGFIQESGTTTMEEVAEDNLNQLVRRGMLQVTKRNYFGRIRECRLHDLMRDLIVIKSGAENFSETYEGRSEVTLSSNVRRLSVIKFDDLPQGFSLLQLRSFFVFSSGTLSLPIGSSIFLKFRLLRVLDLNFAPIESVPNEVTRLVSLHYLGLRRTNIKELPKSIGKLQNLQILDVLRTNVEKVPHGVRKLKKLRHLLVEKYVGQASRYLYRYEGAQVPKQICDLTNLQTLRHVEANAEIIQNLGRLTQMRSFGITQVTNEYSSQLSASIAKMTRLLCLSVRTRFVDNELQLEDLYPPPPELQKLRLCGNLTNGKLPRWFDSLGKLKHLDLHLSGIEQDSLPSLGALPNLVYLSLREAYGDEQLCFQARWFPKLKKLYLYDMAQLNRIDIEREALASLSWLVMRRCHALKVLPQGMENLTSLQDLELEDMPKQLVDRMRAERSEEDYSKVKHIPNIKNWVQQEDGRWIEERLSKPLSPLRSE